MKLSETTKRDILSPVKASPVTFITSQVTVALAKAGNLGTYVATSFELPPNYWGWRMCLNKKASEAIQGEPLDWICKKAAEYTRDYNRERSKKRRRKRL